MQIGIFSVSDVTTDPTTGRTPSEHERIKAAVAIAKAAIVTGAVLAGGHVVYVMRYITRFDAPLPSARVIQGAATIVAALLLAGAGALLERACVVHDGDDDDDATGSPGEPSEGTTGRGHPKTA